MTTLEAYYNKFNEEKRLDSRYGQVEFLTSMTYIHKYLEKLRGTRAKAEVKILDVGAGTGRYAIPLSEEGYDVTAVEPVKHNLGRLKQKGPLVKAYQGNALKLKRLETDEFDLTILFGPMYHLLTHEEKRQALSEALRVTRPAGLVMVVYIMNEYSVLTYAIREGHILENLAEGRLDESFQCVSTPEDLYSVVRLEEIDRLNEEVGASRVLMFAQDGAASYMRRELNALSEEAFAAFVRYHMTTCERKELLGASAHTVDVIRKEAPNA